MNSVDCEKSETLSQLLTQHETVARIDRQSERATVGY